MKVCTSCKSPIETKPGYPDGHWYCPIHGKTATALTIPDKKDKDLEF